MARMQTGETAQTSQELPQIGGRPAGAKAAPRVAPEEAYYLMWHPMEWQVMRGILVPRLTKLHLVHGTNGTDRDRAGRPVPQAAIARAEQAGWTVIPWDIDGPTGKPYLYRASHGGWVSRWERLFPGSTKTAVDEQGYAEWCWSLVERGLVPQPEEWILDDLLDKLQGELNQYRNHSQTSPRIERIHADLRVVADYRKSLEAAEPEAEPEEPADDSLPTLGSPTKRGRKAKEPTDGE